MKGNAGEGEAPQSKKRKERQHPGGKKQTGPKHRPDCRKAIVRGKGKVPGPSKKKKNKKEKGSSARTKKKNEEGPGEPGKKGGRQGTKGGVL